MPVVLVRTNNSLGGSIPHICDSVESVVRTMENYSETNEDCRFWIALTIEDAASPQTRFYMETKNGKATVKNFNKTAITDHTMNRIKWTFGE